MTFDLARAVKDGCRTRDGRPVRIICTDRKGSCPVVALVGWDQSAESESIKWYTKTGREQGCSVTTHLDLVNLPEAHEVTVRLWEATDGQYGFELIPPAIAFDPRYNTPDDWKIVGMKTVRIEKDA